jgi:signal peptide peptidase-like protein 2B
MRQDLAIEVSLSDAAPTLAQYSMYASVALFGPLPHMTAAANSPGTLVTPPTTNPLLCKNITETDVAKLPPNSILLVPRGTCTFQSKVWRGQQLGAKAVLIYHTLESRYGLNETQHEDAYTYNDIIFPLKFFDFDCARGRADIPKTALSFDPLPYNGAVNDPLLSGSDNLCQQNAPDHLKQCASKACLLTGEESSDSNNLKACCAWDLHMHMSADAQQPVPTIPSAFLTIEQGQRLLHDVTTNQHVQVNLYARWRPEYNVASFLIWALGVAACAMAAYMSANDYNKYTAKLLRRQQQQRQNSNNTEDGNSRRTERSESTATPIAEELTVWHALGFVVMASSSLLILFYFKIYGIVKIMYAFGCSNAFANTAVEPLVKRVMKVQGFRNRVVLRTGVEDVGDFSLRDVISLTLSYLLGFSWLVMAFTVRHPDQYVFFWVIQDVFGVCMCIMFLQVIKLNSLQVASALLIVAFFYDIFFVFVSPLIFSKSVMIDVATSGGPPTADELWCEK